MAEYGSLLKDFRGRQKFHATGLSSLQSCFAVKLSLSALMGWKGVTCIAKEGERILDNMGLTECGGNDEKTYLIKMYPSCRWRVYHHSSLVSWHLVALASKLIQGKES